MEMPREKRDARRYYNPLQKDYVTFLETSEETGGERTLIEVEVAPGGGTDLHYHLTDDEHFEVLEGTLELRIGEAPLFLRPGDKATAYKTVTHYFRNPTNGPTRFLTELRPGSSGFEKMLKVGYGLAGDVANGASRNHHMAVTLSATQRPYFISTPTLPNLYHIALLLDWGDVHPAKGPLSFGPLLRFLVKRARRKGIARELEEKYYR